MMEQIYRKIGKRYIQIGQEFAGFPCDGIWLVQNGKRNMSCIIRSDEKVPVHALEYRMHTKELSLRLVDRFTGKPHSWDEVARACCDYFAEVAGE